MPTLNKLKSRFCPSPTGFVHLGNVRTALFNALLAKKESGIFLLRIEDTDLQRSQTQYTEALFKDLLWLGLDWQEGPNKDLGHGPYYQSQRQAIYNQYYEILEAEGKAYPCFCTEEDLALMRKVQAAAGKPPRYAGTCFGLSEQKVSEKIAQGLKPTLRFHVPNDIVITFNDAVRGTQSFKGSDIGDFIIRRADGTAPFMFCNAIDDALMGVTHALRGEDHLTNTPRQVLILQTLNLPVPIYGHISLIIGSDGSPLSKRHGSRNIQELRAQGFFPEAINNYMARLGHYYPEDTFMSLQELATNFSLDNLGKSPARFDYQQLIRWQQETIARKSDEALWEWLSDEARKLIPIEKKADFLKTIKSNILFPEDIMRYALIFFSSDPNSDLDEEKRRILTAAGTHFFARAIDAVRHQGKDFKAVNQYLQDVLQIKGKALFQPLRVALTGELHGPEMGAIFSLLSVDEILVRLQAAENLV